MTPGSYTCFSIQQLLPSTLQTAEEWKRAHTHACAGGNQYIQLYARAIVRNRLRAN